MITYQQNPPQSPITEGKLFPVPCYTPSEAEVFPVPYPHHNTYSATPNSKVVKEAAKV